MLRIKLVKSPIGNTPRNRATIAALGLRRINQVVEHNDSPMIRGMIHHVKHVLEVTEAEGTPKSNLANKRRGTAAVEEKPAKAAKPKAEAKAKKTDDAPAEEAKPKRTTKKAKTEEEN